MHSDFQLSHIEDPATSCVAKWLDHSDEYSKKCSRNLKIRGHEMVTFQ